MSPEERYNKVIGFIREKAKEVLPEGSTITLFGSRARGDAKFDSDWDIHILIPGPEKMPYSQLHDYAFHFEWMGIFMDEQINPVIHTFKGWEKRRFLPLYMNIRKEGRLIYDNDFI